MKWSVVVASAALAGLSTAAGVLMVQTPNAEVRNDFENLVAQSIAD